MEKKDFEINEFGEIIRVGIKDNKKEKLAEKLRKGEKVLVSELNTKNSIPDTRGQKEVYVNTKDVLASAKKRLKTKDNVFISKKIAEYKQQHNK